MATGVKKAKIGLGLHVAQHPEKRWPQECAQAVGLDLHIAQCMTTWMHTSRCTCSSASRKQSGYRDAHS